MAPLCAASDFTVIKDGVNLKGRGQSFSATRKTLNDVFLPV